MKVDQEIEKLTRDILHEIIEGKGTDINLIDLRKISTFADYFVVASANNERQVNAIVQRILQNVDAENKSPRHIEGRNTGKWVLIDFGDVVVHVFHHKDRKFYNIEKLWADGDNIIKIKSDEDWNNRSS